MADENPEININPEIHVSDEHRNRHDEDNSDLDDVSGDIEDLNLDEDGVFDAIEANDFEAFYQFVKDQIEYGTAQEIFIAARRELQSTPEDGIEEALSISQRRARGRVMKRMKSRMRMAKKIAARRRASPDKLKARAVKAARLQIKKKLSAQREYSTLTPSEKVMVDKRMEKVSQKRVDMIARKLLPKVRQKEMERMAKRSSNKSATQKNESEDPHPAGIDELGFFIESSIMGLQEAGICELITHRQIKSLEKVVDSLFKKFKIDFEFTKHFSDRMSDARNSPCISMEDLASFIKKIYAAVKKDKKGLSAHKDAEVVLKDLQQELNIPAAIEYDRKEDELIIIAKTIMRKKNFKTPNKEVKYK